MERSNGKLGRHCEEMPERHGADGDSEEQVHRRQNETPGGEIGKT